MSIWGTLVWSQELKAKKDYNCDSEWEECEQQIICSGEYYQRDVYRQSYCDEKGRKRSHLLVIRHHYM